MRKVGEKERKRERKKEIQEGRTGRGREGGLGNKERKKFDAQNHGSHFFPARVPLQHHHWNKPQKNQDISLRFPWQVRSRAHLRCSFAVK